MKIMNYKEFEASLTEEQKKKAKEMYDKAMEGMENLPPLYCGPEARARAAGPEAYKKYCEDCAKYVRKVSIEDWD